MGQDWVRWRRGAVSLVLRYETFVRIQCQPCTPKVGPRWFRGSLFLLRETWHPESCHQIPQLCKGAYRLLSLIAHLHAICFRWSPALGRSRLKLGPVKGYRNRFVDAWWHATSRQYRSNVTISSNGKIADSHIHRGFRG